MDGKGCQRDNQSFKRLWRGIKYEDVYLRALETTTQLGRATGPPVQFYNPERPHNALGAMDFEQTTLHLAV